LETTVKIAISALALLTGATLFATRPNPAVEQAQETAQAHFKLASLSTAARRDVDYALLDQRLQQLMTKPQMVGLAVGIVENGRITFLRGSGHSRDGVPLGVGVEGGRGDDGRQARRAGEGRPEGACRELCS
jgi:beta-lactamase class C